MESLLAAYSSSSDDEEQQSSSKPQTPTNPTSSNQPEPIKIPSLFSSLPKPKSPSIPPPKNQSKIPQKPRKVIHVKLPSNQSLDDDSDDEEKTPKKKPNQETQTTSSLKSFFSSLPAPRNSLGLGSGQSLGGRKSVIGSESVPKNEIRAEQNEIRAEQNEIRAEQKYEEGGLVNGASYYVAKSGSGGDSNPNWYQNNVGYENYEGNYVGNNVNSEGGYGHYDGAATMAPMPMPVASVDAIRNVGRGKRGRNEMPEFIEVNQDELMKNRPREDQAKTTGIAFGPAYQTVSSKGKPSKLHKRKHQIGALYFDMRQNEMALTERRSKGFLTKAETQAKYGW